jgi:non-heme chloroperoxidase
MKHAPRCFLALLVLLGAPLRAQSPATRFIAVEKDVKLEVVDWGGSGRVLVLLAGLGVTARDFDDFATALRKDYRVFGITRRGFPPSSIPTTGYAADRLGDDVLAVMDSLRLERPVLVGHSVAGGELSSIGSRFPERVSGLVYLDAGYEYAFYDASAGDYRIDVNEVSRRLEQLRYARPRDQSILITQLVDTLLPALERTLRARRSQLPPPRQSPVAASAAPRPFSVHEAIQAGKQRYTRILSPVLAIYAMPRRLRGNRPLDSSSLAAWEKLEEWAQTQSVAFERGITGARVIRIPFADHFVFRSNEAAVLRAINAFVDSIPR